MKLGFKGDYSEVKKGIEILQKRLGFVPVFDGEGELTIDVSVDNSHALCYSIKGNEGSISYEKPCNFFRALALGLAAYKRGEAVNRSEDSNFTMDGVMVDCSRNAVPTVAGAKDMLEAMACMGLDMMMLYTEDTYEIPELPYFGYMRGKLSQAEIKEIDKYAIDLGIELIPCIQTAAHLMHALKWPWADPIWDFIDALLVGEEKTYEFLDKAIKSCADTFTTKRIHIGYDEAIWVGRGKYLERHGYEKNTVLLQRHLVRVKEILKKYDRIPMMWGDMYLNMYNENGTKEEDGMGVVYWNYYEHEQETYEKTIDKYREFSDNVIFAGGSWTWGMLVAPYYQTLTTTMPALRACVTKGVKEVLATMWGDDGQETTWFAGLPGLQMYAEYRYCGKDIDSVTEELIASRMKDCIGADLQAFKDMARIDLFKDAKEYREFPGNPSKAVLWSNPMMSVYDKDLENAGKLFDLDAHYQEFADKLKVHAKSGNAYSWLFEFPAELASFCKSKWSLGLRLKKAYDEGDKVTLGKIADEMVSLIEQAKLLRELHKKQWFMNCKSFGWDVMDVRYGALVNHMETGVERIRFYVEGKIEVLEELAQERLPFGETVDEMGRMGVTHWNRVVTGCPL
ncbi:MAG: beta-N-acetylhexosaminidase [Ruminococcaceae bacterium]|nr:beta-N-acetylhexosaminidase [Oscillospiraceae bacterium]